MLSPIRPKKARGALGHGFDRADGIPDNSGDVFEFLLSGVRHRFGERVRLTHLAQLIDCIDLTDCRAQRDTVVTSKALSPE